MGQGNEGALDLGHFVHAHSMGLGTAEWEGRVGVALPN